MSNQEPKCEHDEKDSSEPCPFPPLGWTIEKKTPRCAIHSSEAGDKPAWKPTD